LEDSLVAIELAEADAGDAGVRELLEARPARARGHVARRAIDHHAVLRRLKDRVGLGVDRRDAVAVLHHMADIRAVRHAADRAVVAGRQDRPILHEHGADVLARAGRPRRDDLRDAHEVVVPRGALGFVVHASESMTLYGPRPVSKYKETVILPET